MERADEPVQPHSPGEVVAHGDGLTATVTTRQGLERLIVDVGELRAVFLPTVGGRLISLAWHGHEYLWRNPIYFDEELELRLPRERWPRPDESMSSWANVGGAKTWPAPQGWDGPGQWPGPPDPVLDGGFWAFTARIDDNTLHLSFLSPFDERSGLQVAKDFRFTAGQSGMAESIRFTAPRAVRWAIWEVVQVPTGSIDGDGPSGVYVTVKGTRRPLNLLPELPPLRHERVARDAIRVPLQGGVGKLGFPSATGALRYRYPGGAELRLNTAVVEDVPYPDAGSRVEVWMQSPRPDPIAQLGGLHPDAHLAELELLSPLHEIRSGSPAQMQIDWSLSDADHAENEFAPTPKTRRKAT